MDLLLGEGSYKVVTGYKGFTPIFAAIHQNEVQYHTTSTPGYSRVVEPTMEQPGLVKVLFQYETPTADGRFIRNGDLPNLLTWLELYKMKFGKDAMPKGMKWQALNHLNTLLTQVFRIVPLPPNSPKAARDALRIAFAAVVTDKMFLAAYRKAIKASPNVIVGAAGEKIVTSLESVDPKLFAFFRKFSQGGTR